MNTILSVVVLATAIVCLCEAQLLGGAGGGLAVGGVNALEVGDQHNSQLSAGSRGLANEQLGLDARTKDAKVCYYILYNMIYCTI